jgi:hypothetical protein
MKAFPSSWAKANTSIEPLSRRTCDKQLRPSDSSRSTNRDIERAITSFLETRVDALLVSPNPLLDNRRAQVVTLAAYHRLPAIYPFRDNVEIGGLMSYGSSASERDRLVGIYVARILKEKNNRVAGHTAVRVRVGHQPTDRETAWHRGPTHTPRARRRGPRMAIFFGHVLAAPAQVS